MTYRLVRASVTGPKDTSLPLARQSYTNPCSHYRGILRSSHFPHSSNRYIQLSFTPGITRQTPVGMLIDH